MGDAKEDDFLEDAADPECAMCHSMVSVTPGCEWEPGEVCNLCVYDQRDTLRAQNARLREALEKVIDYYSDGGVSLTDQTGPAAGYEFDLAEVARRALEEG